MIVKKRIINFVNIDRFVFRNIAILAKSYCYNFYILDILYVVLVITVDTLIDVKTSTSFIVYQRELDAI